MAVDPTTFKAFFDRGQFTYGATVPDIRDRDIQDALDEANAVFNPDIYPPDHPEIGEKALTYLTAHFLVSDLDAADSGAQTRLMQNARSADGVSESLTIPDWMNAGEFAFYAATYYGQKWLILTKPYLDGVILSATGATQV